MRLLVDECLSERTAKELCVRGHDAVHVGARGLLSRPDTEVMSCARAEQRVLVSADTDFGELLAHSGAQLPSLILLRRPAHEPISQADAVHQAIGALTDELIAGAVVVITDDRIRVRSLPIAGSAPPIS